MGAGRCTLPFGEPDRSDGYVRRLRVERCQLDPFLAEAVDLGHFDPSYPRQRTKCSGTDVITEDGKDKLSLVAMSDQRL